MHRQALRFSVLLLAFILLLCHQVASASSQGSDTTVTVSPFAASRALAVSEPPPPPPPPPPPDIPGGRVLFAPAGIGPGEQFGNSVANAGDVNGDGYLDLIVGSWTSDVPTADAGSAYVYFGGPAADAIPDLVLHGQSFDDNFGTSVASAGDVNGDGYGDLIVGAWRAVSSTRTGRAYVFFGGATPDAAPDLVLSGEALNDHFGVSVASAGDLNGDGFSDMIVGASGYPSGAGVGRAYVYFGGSVPNSVVDARLTGSTIGDSFGFAVASGDWNGDGSPDVLVGAPGAEGTGRAYLYFGGPGFDAIADRTFVGEALGDNFGTSLAFVGDVNGDGSSDVAIGAHGNDAGGLDAGRAYVFHGGPGANTSPDLTLTGLFSGDRFGQSVASAGDMDGDGFGDLVVGAWLSDAKAPDAGSAYVYYMGSQADAVPDVALAGEGADDRFGISVAGAGDFNHDGDADVIVGAYFNDSNGGDAGRAYVMTLDASRPPIVTAPAVVAGIPNVALSFEVMATDPDGDAITALAINVLPSGATFTKNDSNTSGTFRWTPTASQMGEYVVVFTASNARSGTATTQITVGSLNHPPVLNPVADMSVNEGSVADQILGGSDPDGDALSFSLTTGPAFASVTTIDAVSGNLHVAPGFGDAGSYPATVRAADGHAGFASAALTVVVNHTNRPPVLSGPAGIFGAEGVAMAATVSATDPDGDHVTLSALNRPVGSLFVDLGTNSGTFNWTPGFGQAGSYIVTFVGRDGHGGSGTRDLAIVVDDINRAPTADPGGPYAGVVNVPVTFNGTGSSDPDGSFLNYLWSFGDAVTAAGVTPSHSYAAGGTYVVTLTVDDGMQSDAGSTVATIQDVFSARVFTTSANRVIRLGSGKAAWCSEIEPVGGSFLETSVLASTIVAKYSGRQIVAMPGGLSIGADKDANSVQEMTVCFAKTDLRSLFTGLPKGTSTVTLILEGDLNTGGKFRGTVTVDVVSSGGTMAASVSPNPLNPTAVLTFSTTRAGLVRVSVFDLLGRRVRVLESGAHMEPGYHDIMLDGRSDRGETLPSGAYFYRIEAAEGSETGRFVIVK